MKDARPYDRARAAFKRLHLYEHRPGEFGHQRWLDGWLEGYKAGKRAKRRSR